MYFSSIRGGNLQFAPEWIKFLMSLNNQGLFINWNRFKVINAKPVCSSS